MRPTFSKLTAAALALAAVAAGIAPANAQPDPQTWAPIGEFAVAPDTSVTRERVQGTADFVRVASLPASDPDAQLSRKVGIMHMVFEENGSIYKASCTGSLVGPDLFLTNHHCVVNGNGERIPTAGFRVDMNFLTPGENGPSSGVSGVNEVLALNESLDFALLRLARPLGDTIGWLQIDPNPNTLRLERAVKIIQHPDGRPKELVRKNTSIVRTEGFVMHYMADTEGGSSGSPVFGLNDDKIIALHHVGTNYYNEGIQMAAIYPRISQFLPIAASSSAPPVATAASTPPPTAPATTRRSSPAPAPQPAAQPAAQPAPQPAAPPPAAPSSPQPDPSGWTAIGN